MSNLPTQKLYAQIDNTSFDAARQPSLNRLSSRYTSLNDQQK